MGFFSDLKEDLNQAVNELLPDGDKSEPAANSAKSNETLQELANLEAMLQNIDDLHAEKLSQTQEEEAPVTFTQMELNIPAAEEPAPTEPEEAPAPTPILMVEEEEIVEELVAPAPKAVAPVQKPAPAPAPVKAPTPKAAAPVQQTAPIRGTAAERMAAERKAEEIRMAEIANQNPSVIDKSWVLDLTNMEEMEETAVITAGMRVKGDILSNGSADVFGEVFGNVQVKGKLNVTGRIAGNSKAAEILVESAKINGDLLSDGAVQIGVGTVVVGNVEGTDAVIAGAVKGAIDIRGPVIIDSTAVVLGDVKAKSIQINNGARIEGMCELCYAEQSAAKFFEEQES